MQLANEYQNIDLINSYLHLFFNKTQILEPSSIKSHQRIELSPTLSPVSPCVCLISNFRSYLSREERKKGKTNKCHKWLVSNNLLELHSFLSSNCKPASYSIIRSIVGIAWFFTLTLSIPVPSREPWQREEEILRNLNSGFLSCLEHYAKISSFSAYAITACLTTFYNAIPASTVVRW